MHGESILFTLFLIFTGASIVAGLALFARQSMLVAYIALGALVGPWGLGLVEDATTAQGIGEVGIIFLLYLLGLNLHPLKLVRMMREATLVTLWSSLGFAAAGTAAALALGFRAHEALVMGALSVFSSTIIGLKLLPTTTLHHRHAGEVVISVLLLQDIVAIVMLLGLDAASRSSLSGLDALLLGLALPVVLAVSVVVERWVLIRSSPVSPRYASTFSSSRSAGASVSPSSATRWGSRTRSGHSSPAWPSPGVPVATFIAESLKPLRDFFLVMFFFALGAGFPLPCSPKWRSLPRAWAG